MKFRSKYDKAVIVASEPGQRLAPEYQLVVKEDGTTDLEQVGYTDLHEMIQSHKDSVDINMIMARVKNGETDLLDKAKGIYADVTELPCSLQDALNVGLRGESFYNNLPLDVKKQFTGYIDMVNNPDKLMKAIEDYKKQPEKQPVKQPEKQPEKQSEEKGSDE